MDTTQRAAFEAWMLTNPPEAYMEGWNGAVALAVWQASRKQITEEMIAKLRSVEPWDDLGLTYQRRLSTPEGGL